MTKTKHPQNKFERLKVRRKYAPVEKRFEDQKKREEHSSSVWRKAVKEQLKAWETEYELHELRKGYRSPDLA